MQVLWVAAVGSSCLRFSTQHAALHPAAFHTAWVLTLIGLLFFIKAQLLHKTLLQRQCRKTLLGLIGLLCMGVGAAGSVQIMMMRHSHIRAQPSLHGPVPPGSFSDSVNSRPLMVPDLLSVASTAQHLSSQVSWQTGQHHGFFPAEERYASIAQVMLALVCTVSASMSAHGAAGYVFHHHATNKARVSTWAFFQPFRVRFEPHYHTSSALHGSCSTLHCLSYCDDVSSFDVPVPSNLVLAGRCYFHSSAGTGMDPFYI